MTMILPAMLRSLYKRAPELGARHAHHTAVGRSSEAEARAYADRQRLRIGDGRPVEDEISCDFSAFVGQVVDKQLCIPVFRSHTGADVQHRPAVDAVAIDRDDVTERFR